MKMTNEFKKRMILLGTANKAYDAAFMQWKADGFPGKSQRKIDKLAMVREKAEVLVSNVIDREANLWARV